MALDLDIRSFFRKAPRAWLQRYFAHHGTLGDFDWSSIGKIKVDALHETWLRLDEAVRSRLTEDFRNLTLLATAGGKLAIIDEAEYWAEEKGVAEKLGALEDFLACAFWTYLERPQYWNGAVFFAAADTKPRRDWRKRINMPFLGRKPTEADGRALSAALGQLFMQREGRGIYCMLHQYRRGEREYYFAYPQDHPQTSIEYSAGEMTKRPYNPAFEIIFVHNDIDQTLRIWHHGSTDRVKDLQVTFARAVLGSDIPRDRQRDTRVYDLSPLARRDFKFEASPELGIQSAEVRHLRLHILGPHKHSFTVAIGNDTAREVLFDRIDAATSGVPKDAIRVSQAGIRVRFELQPGEQKQRIRNFEISWPNSCSLHNDGGDIMIQHLLTANGIEARLPPQGQGGGEGH